jgi:glycosyltransferase involved in cell wall biosynthesis
MRIAFISYEYAGSASGGGIGTYVRNAARMLADRGHQVEVFCAGDRDGRAMDAGVVVSTIVVSHAEFAEAILPPFAARHSEQPFDVIEGPEYGADAAGIRHDFPDVPLIVRLHTPSSVISEINHSYIDFSSKLRFIAGGLRRGKLPKPYWRHDSRTPDEERHHTLGADLVVAPSQAILEKLGRDWGLPPERTMVVPNVFIPPAALLALEAERETKTILFIGKLEVRKGVLELAKAVPLVAQEMPDARFVFVGRSLPMPGSNLLVGDIMRREYGSSEHMVSHLDAVPYENIPDLFRDASVAVFPSAWESFGYVTLEAMSAACGVVGSSAGGMAEMIEPGRTGLLVPPRNPMAIARAIVELLKDPQRRIAMGKAAREHVLGTYASDRIGPLHEASLTRAVKPAASRRE